MAISRTRVIPRATGTRWAGAFGLWLLAGCGEPARRPSETPPPPPPSVTASAALSPTEESPAKTDDPFLVACRADLAKARAISKSITDVTAPRTLENTLVPYNDLLIALQNPGTRASLYSEVHPNAATRDAAQKCVEEVSSLQSETNLNPALWKAIASLESQKLDPEAMRFVTRTLRDFRRSGVDKPESVRKELKRLTDEMTSVGLEFDKNIREDVRKVSLAPEALKGLPEDYRKEHPVGPDGKVTLTTDYPDYLPFAKYGEDTAARKALFLEYMNRGFPKNEAVLKKLLKLRKEYATLLGYPSYADYITEDKMIGSSQKAVDFVDKITRASAARAKGDVAELLAMKKKSDPAAKEVFDWEKALYSEKVKREAYAFDSQSVRPYFEFRKTRDGLLAITAKMYGVTYEPVTNAEKWHADVDVYDVVRDGKKLGRIYLDLHPREGKYKHAANFGLVPGVRGVQLPESVLVCNFADPKTGEGLMDHDDVETFFHEFGHLMHSILGADQRWVYFSGIANEWDFVEAPSQMFEEWAWDPGVLGTFAKHNATGKPLPPELIKSMRRANEFGKGSDARQQMFYAALSLRLHREADPSSLDLTQVLKETQAKYGMFGYVEGTHLFANFGHLNGYSAMYYTYMWSLVIAKDLLTEFKKGGLMDPKTTRKYADTILRPGGTKDAADLVKDFLGRPYNFKAYEAWLNAK